MNDPWDLNEVQRRQFREAQAAARLAAEHSKHQVAYRVIYRFGSTEVPSMREHDTREEAQAEADAADDEGLDETWIEPEEGSS
jgi:hypothetical protein